MLIDGSDHMVAMRMETLEKQQVKIDLCGKLSIAEQEIADGAESEDFADYAKELRGSIQR